MTLPSNKQCCEKLMRIHSPADLHGSRTFSWIWNIVLDPDPDKLKSRLLKNSDPEWIFRINPSGFTTLFKSHIQLRYFSMPIRTLIGNFSFKNWGEISWHCPFTCGINLPRCRNILSLYLAFLLGHWVPVLFVVHYWTLAFVHVFSLKRNLLLNMNGNMILT